MDIALSGFEADDPEDPILISLPTIVEQPALSGPVSQARLEDIQLWSWLECMAAYNAISHPISIEPGSDPPDRLLTVDNVSYAVELSTLTMQELRVNLARIRRIGRLVAEYLNAEPTVFPHLADRHVAISASGLEDTVSVMRNPEAVACGIVEALRVDRGHIGEDVDMKRLSVEGWPERLPFERGFYPDVFGLLLQVNHHPRDPAHPIPVTAGAQSQFKVSELRKLLKDRVSKKDVPANKVLLLSTGLPDTSGYVCPLDRWLFQVLTKHGIDGFEPPKNLDAIYLHHWGTLEVAQLYHRANTQLFCELAPNNRNTA